MIAAARELGHLGIRANVVNPGPIDNGWMNADLRTELVRHQPTGRLGTPPDDVDIAAAEDSAASRGEA